MSKIATFDAHADAARLAMIAECERANDIAEIVAREAQAVAYARAGGGRGLTRAKMRLAIAQKVWRERNRSAA